MHRATVHKEVNWSHPVTEGAYLLEDHNAAELLWASGCHGEVEITAQKPPPFDKEKLWQRGKRVLIVRVGGFGDLLWLNPIYQAMREAGVYVAHCSFERYKDVLEGFIDEWVPYPLNDHNLSGFDEVVWLENSIEGEACLDDEHPAERLAEMLGVPEGLDLAPCGYDLHEEEIEWASQIWPRTEGVKRICLQCLSSGTGKNYPHMFELFPMVHQKGYEILVVGEPRTIKEEIPDRVFDCTQQDFTMRQSIAMASHCDLIVAPDSAFVHVGGALDIPTLGLFGPFSGSTYMKGYKGKAIQGRGRCSPCSWHPRGTPFPPDGPCVKTGRCNALANVPAKDVLWEINQLLK